MQFESMHVTRNTYGPRQGEYSGTMCITGYYGEIHLNLDGKLSAEIIKLVAESLVRASQDVANNMTKDIIESQNLLPAPEEDTP